MLSWSGDYLNYKSQLSQNDKTSAPNILKVQVFNNSVMQEEAEANIILPYTDKQLRDGGYSKLAVDFSLGCNGELDQDCR